MPIYEYACPCCNLKKEIFSASLADFSQLMDLKCPACNIDLVRLISKSTFVLKGSGWYATDYQKK